MRNTCVFLTLVLLSACSRPEERAYYTLRYPAPVMKFGTAHPVVVRVKDLAVRESYDRSELALRDDLVELRYASARRWSESPHQMITDVVRDHLARSGLVKDVLAEVGQQPPDYTLTGEVIAIEQVRMGDEFAARLAMSLRLVRFKDDETVWTYTFDERRPAGDGQPRTTVRTQREILAARLELAFADLDRHLKGEPPLAPPETQVVLPAGAGRVVPNLLDALPQAANDPTPIPIGQGALFVPAYTAGAQEPGVTVLAGGGVVAEGQPGRRIALPPGDYDARFGTGTFAQQVRVAFRIEEGRTTILPATWAGLVVDVVNDNFVPVRTSYELIRMDDRDEYGVGFGADRLQGEQLRTWVLPPGLYKLIRSGGTYRDRTDFATIRLSAGELSRFTLVVDEATGQFLGAGEADPEELADQKDSNWALSGVLGGTATFNRTDLVGKKEGWDLGGTLFFDTTANYQVEAHQWVTRLELEEELSRPADGDFVNKTDRLFFHSIYTYQLIPWFGPYARAGLETSFFDRYQVFDKPQEVDELDASGALVKTKRVDRVRLGSTWAPLSLREGAGGNFRVLRARNLDLDLRLGFGARQTWANDLLLFETVKKGNNRVRPARDGTPLGPEGTVVGTGRLSRWITVTSEFDGLMPLNDEEAVFTWRNQASLRLIQFLSINYRFNAIRDPDLDVEATVRTEHDVQLRFSYTLF